MSHAYVVSAHKPTAVVSSVTARFTGPQHSNLIIAYTTRLEISLLTKEGQEPQLEVPIYGRIMLMEVMSPPGEHQDLLLICTEKYQMCILGFDTATQQIITRASGDLKDRASNLGDQSHFTAVEPQFKMLGLHLYNGLFKIIPLTLPRSVASSSSATSSSSRTSDKFKVEEAFDVRLDDLNIFSLVFLHNNTTPNTTATSSSSSKHEVCPTIAYICDDAHQPARHVKTFSVSIKDQTLRKGPWELFNVENGASRLIAIPAPYGGVVIVGECSLCFYDGKTQRTVPLFEPTEIKAIESIDATRYLLGDALGKLWLLVLEHKSNRIIDMKVEPLGQISPPSTITYLDNGIVFVGSALGDSQLIRLLKERGPDGNAVEILESYTNLGPILQMCVVDVDNQGQVVTCSGHMQSGSIRIVRNGIGVNEQAQIAMPGIKALFALSGGLQSPMDVAGVHETTDQFLVQSFVSETRVLGFDSEGAMEEVTLPGLDAHSHTLVCCDVIHKQIVQVTPKCVRLLSGTDHTVVAQWAPKEGSTITVATANHCQIFVSVGMGEVLLFEIQEASLKQVASADLKFEVACADLTPLSRGDSASNSSNTLAPAQILAVGLWKDLSVRLYQIPSFELLTSESLGEGTIPRSVVMCSMDGQHHLLVGLGDGQLCTYNIDNAGSLTNRRKLALGTQPINLRLFSNRGKTHVFASSDRPAIIHSANKRLVCSNVNFKEVTHMCRFNSEMLPDSLAVANEQGLMLGTIDSIQKLHIRTVPIESPRAIAHSSKHHAYAVIHAKQTDSANDPTGELSYLSIIDERSLEVTCAYAFRTCELAASVTMCTFGNDPSEYIVVSTGMVDAAQTEPVEGRVLLFALQDKELNVVAMHRIDGCGYSVMPFNGKLLIACNSVVEILRWDDMAEGSRELTSECRHSCQVLLSFVQTRGDFILAGDLMKSISVLMYKPADAKIEDIAKDYNPFWIMSCSFLSDDHFVSAEDQYNMMITHKNADAANDEDRQRLDIVGEYHIGDMVNVICPGSLVMHTPEMENLIQGSFVFGTTGGMLGLLLVISPESFQFFSKLQNKLREVIHGVGDFTHAEWRSMTTDHKHVPSRNFIDGDLIESFLELSLELMTDVAKHMEMSVEELVRRVEEMQRLH